MAGLNAAGNPTYDWAQAQATRAGRQERREVLPPHGGAHREGRIYAFGRSDLFPQHPGSGPAWMGGWALAKFDASGKRHWATRLVAALHGHGLRAGRRRRGVGYFAEAVVYHYNRDGLLVGSARPGKPAGGVSGWLDNTASIACNRDPRDGQIDVFAEEDYAHRILWYRLTIRRSASRGRRSRSSRPPWGHDFIVPQPMPGAG